MLEVRLMEIGGSKRLYYKNSNSPNKTEHSAQPGDLVAFNYHGLFENYYAVVGYLDLGLPKSYGLTPKNSTPKSIKVGRHSIYNDLVERTGRYKIKRINDFRKIRAVNDIDIDK